MTDNKIATKQDAALARDKANDLKSMLLARKDEILAIANKVIDPETMVMAVMQEARVNPDLLKCSTVSVYSAMMDAAAMGVLPNRRVGEATLVPRKRSMKNQQTGEWETFYECDLMVMIGGLRKACLNTGQVRDTKGQVVCANDDFEYDPLTNQVLRHKYVFGKPRGEVIGAYGWVELADGTRLFEVMDKTELDKARAMAADSPAWKTWTNDMYAKTPERRCIKRHGGLRTNPSLARAFMFGGEAPVEVEETEVDAAPPPADRLKRKLGLVSGAGVQGPEPLPDGESEPREPGSSPGGGAGDTGGLVGSQGRDQPQAGISPSPDHGKEVPQPANPSAEVPTGGGGVQPQVDASSAAPLSEPIPEALRPTLDAKASQLKDINEAGELTKRLAAVLGTQALAQEAKTAEGIDFRGNESKRVVALTKLRDLVLLREEEAEFIKRLSKFFLTPFHAKESCRENDILIPIPLDRFKDQQLERLENMVVNLENMQGDELRAANDPAHSDEPPPWGK